MSIKRFHIACCGRSGSTYVFKALSLMGIPVLHEANHTWPINNHLGIKYFAENPDVFLNYRGIIGWKWALLTPSYANTFPIQFHLVRSPLKAIESATTHSDKLFDQVERHIGRPDFIPTTNKYIIKLGRAIHYWIYYNKFLEKQSIRLNIETFKPGGHSFDLFCQYTNVESRSAILFKDLPKNTNTRETRFRIKKLKSSQGFLNREIILPRKTLTWSILKDYFPEQANILLEMASSYGYDPKTSMTSVAPSS